MSSYFLYNYVVNINIPVLLSLSIMPPYLLYNEQKIHQFQEVFHKHIWDLHNDIKELTSSHKHIWDLHNDIYELTSS